ncbi:MAG: trypsin-like peptidase domain-containing protein [Bacteroidota bacterium]
MKNLLIIKISILFTLLLFSCQEKIENIKRNQATIEATFEAFDELDLENFEAIEIESIKVETLDIDSTYTVDIQENQKTKPAFQDIDSLTTRQDSIQPLGDANIGLRPYNLTGRLSFIKNGIESYCTCQFVDYDIVITAAHCVFDLSTKRWHENFVVYQGYRNGTYRKRHAYKLVRFPVEFWKAKKTHNVAEWDYAFIKLYSKSEEGHFGIKTLGSATVSVVGYPRNIKNGEVLQVEHSKQISNRLPYRYLIVPSNFREGSSGGAWYDSSYYVRSVTSMRFNNGYIAGAVFGNKVISDFYDIRKKD